MQYLDEQAEHLPITGQDLPFLNIAASWPFIRIGSIQVCYKVDKVCQKGYKRMIERMSIRTIVAWEELMAESKTTQ